MSDRLERDARWIRLAVWTGALVVLVVIGAVTINVVQNKQLAAHKLVAQEAPLSSPAVVAPPKAVDYDVYERANAERNSELIAREAAAYDAYSSARKATDEPALRKRPEAPKP